MASPVTGLLLSGIVNPFGPTVNAVVAVGELKVGARLPVVRLMLNPFQQAVEEVGTLTLGKTWRPAAVIPQLFGLRAGSCPSLILPLEQLKSASAGSLFAEFLRGFDDARGVLDRVREYYGNPWDRVSQEMRLATQRLTDPDARPAEEHEPLSEDESRELAELLLADEHNRPELEALFEAWKGSIQHVGTPALASLPVDRFLAIMEHICRAVRVLRFNYEDGSGKELLQGPWYPSSVNGRVPLAVEELVKSGLQGPDEVRYVIAYHSGAFPYGMPECLLRNLEDIPARYVAPAEPGGGSDGGA